MKCIWSIGNKINDGHKALAVLTLNNLLFDAKSFTFYMTQCLSSQPCALTVKLDADGGGWMATASVWTSEDERFLTLHQSLLCVLHDCVLRGEETWPLRRSLKLKLGKQFGVMLLPGMVKGNILSQRVMEGSEWSCPTSEWCKKTSSQQSFISFSLFLPSACYFAGGVDWFHAFQQDNPSLADSDEPFSCTEGRLKMLPPQPRG